MASDFQDGGDMCSDVGVGDLAPPDRGRGAWSYLLGCYMLEGAVWGFAVSWGVFQNHLTTTAPFSANPSALPIVGTTAVSLAFAGMPLINPIMQSRPRLLVPTVYVGFVMCLVSLILASFATSVTQLILTQGVLFGVGWAVCYTPFLLMLNQWFVKRRGTAYGILLGSSGLAAMVLPFLLEAGLVRYGFRTTLRIGVVGILVVAGPGMVLIRPRFLPTPKGRSRFNHSPHLMKNPTFLLLNAAVLMQSLAWFLPRFFLPSFATDAKLNPSSGAVFLSIFGIAQVVGQFSLGYASDKMNAHVPMALSTGVTGSSAFLLWGPARTFADGHAMLALCFFVVLYGSFGGGYGVLWTRMGALVSADEDVMMGIYGSFSVMRGVGNVIAGPVSGALISDRGVDLSKYALGRYVGVVVFVGVGMLVSGVISGSVMLVPKKEWASVEEEMVPFVQSGMERADAEMEEEMQVAGDGLMEA